MTQKVEAFSNEVKSVEEFSASNLDDALDLLTITGASSSSSGRAALLTDKVDRHPERRYKVTEDREPMETTLYDNVDMFRKAYTAALYLLYLN